MKGLTNASNSSKSGLGNIVFAVNNTGADIVAGQKVWLNKHNDTAMDSDWISTDSTNYDNGFFIFPNADNNFVAYNGSDTKLVGSYATDTQTWNITSETLANQSIKCFSMNYANGKYYGWYIPTGGFNSSTNLPDTVIYDNNQTFEFFSSALVLSDKWEISKGSAPYKYLFKDKSTNDTIELDWTENKEVIYSAFLTPDNYFFIITKGYSNDIIYTRYFSLVRGSIGLTIVAPIGADPAMQAVMTQPCIKYCAGSYLITSSTVTANINYGYGLIIYKIKSYMTDNRIIVADDLPDDLQALIGTACVARYDDRTKRLYVSNATEFFMFDFVDGKFVNANLALDTSKIFTVYRRSHTFSVSDDKTTIFINGDTSTSEGKLQMLKLSNPDDTEWYAENFEQSSSLSLTGYATGNTVTNGRYEISTVLGES